MLENKKMVLRRIGLTENRKIIIANCALAQHEMDVLCECKNKNTSTIVFLGKNKANENRVKRILRDNPNILNYYAKKELEHQKEDNINTLEIKSLKNGINDQ